MFGTHVKGLLVDFWREGQLLVFHLLDDLAALGGPDALVRVLHTKNDTKKHECYFT